MGEQRDYRVECQGEVREVYIVRASSPEDAMARWHEGDLAVSEAYGVDAVSAEVDDDG